MCPGTNKRPGDDQAAGKDQIHLWVCNSDQFIQPPARAMQLPRFGPGAAFFVWGYHDQGWANWQFNGNLPDVGLLESHYEMIGTLYENLNNVGEMDISY